MDNEYLSAVETNGESDLQHAWKVFDPKYYKKIKTGFGKRRYFYSEKEYRAYLDNLRKKAERSSDSNHKSSYVGTVDAIKQKEEAKKQARRQAIRQQEQERENAIAKSREVLKQQDAEKQKTEQEKEARRQAIRQQEQGREKAIAKSRVSLKKQEDAKEKEIEQRKQLPEKVSATDYIFGGKYLKNLKTAKKELRKTAKEIDTAKKQSERLLKRIKDLEGKKRLNSRQRQRLEAYRSENREIWKGIRSNIEKQNKQRDDLAVAVYQYHGATLVGGIKKSIMDVGSKAQSIINKCKRVAIKSIKTPKIKLRKKD